MALPISPLDQRCLTTRYDVLHDSFTATQHTQKVLPYSPPVGLAGCCMPLGGERKYEKAPAASVLHAIIFLGMFHLVQASRVAGSMDLGLVPSSSSFWTSSSSMVPFSLRVDWKCEVPRPCLPVKESTDVLGTQEKPHKPLEQAMLVDPALVFCRQARLFGFPICLGSLSLEQVD